jgi:flagellar biosynthesis protein FlhF
MATNGNPQIRLKSYFAKCVTDAMEVARRELGPDALLLDSRPSPPEARHLGPLEVIFGETSENARKNAPPASVTTVEIDELCRKVDDIRSLLVRTTASTPYGGARARPVQQVLIDAGLTGALADEIDEAVYLQIRARAASDNARHDKNEDVDPQLVLRTASDELNFRIQVRPELGKVTALVGPPGSGKTSALVKLAIREGLMKNRPVRLLSADTFRIAASEQLRIYAAILGVPYQIAESSSALAQAADAAPAGSLLLIDTPGLSPALLEGPGADLAAFFRSRQDIDIQLVLTATTQSRDMEKATNRFAAFRPSASIFTRLDETDSLATLFCEVVRNKMPVSYLCNGQIIPEDLESATKERITEGLVLHLLSVLTPVSE